LSLVKNLSGLGIGLPMKIATDYLTGCAFTGRCAAMAAGLTPSLLSMADVVGMIDADEAKALADKRRELLVTQVEAAN
jgi:hypothetical protein